MSNVFSDCRLETDYRDPSSPVKRFSNILDFLSREKYELSEKKCGLISFRSSRLMHFLPTQFRCREGHLQYSLNPARCQRMTVSGLTRINARVHPGQSLYNITQKNSSDGTSRGCGSFRFKTESCYQGARFSKSGWRRERNNRERRTARSLNRSSMRSVLHLESPKWHLVYA